MALNFAQANVFEFRTYDPQLGLWWQADPLMQHASSYLAMSNNPVLFTDPLGLWDGTGAQRGEFRYGDGAWYVFLGGKEGWMLAEDQNDDTYLSVVNYYREKNRYLNNFPAQPDNYVDWTKNFQFAIEQNRPGLELAAKVCEYTPELAVIEAEALALSGKVIYEGGAYYLKGKIRKEVAENLLGSGLGKAAKGALPRSGPIIKSVGAASRAEMLAIKLKLNIYSPTTRQVVNSLDDTVESFISQFRKPSIRSELPGEFLNITVEEALLSGNTTVRKLLVDSRFVK